MLFGLLMPRDARFCGFITSDTDAGKTRPAPGQSCSCGLGVSPPETLTRRVSVSKGRHGCSWTFLVCALGSARWSMDTLVLKTQACLCRFTNRNTAVSVKGDKAQVRRLLVKKAALSQISAFIKYVYY